MYKRILVPVDGSATSRLGFRHALELARQEHARLRILHVVDYRDLAPVVDSYALADAGLLYEASKRKAERMTAAFVRDARKAKVQGESGTADASGHSVADAIVKDAANWRADLIVMGTHGLRGVARVLLGSDAERVAREAPVPVLLVRAKKTKSRRTRTVLPLQASRAAGAYA